MPLLPPPHHCAAEQGTTTQEQDGHTVSYQYDDDTRQLVTSALNATIGKSCGVMLDHGDTDKLLTWLDSRGLAIGNDATHIPTEQQFEPSNNNSNTINITITIDGNNPYAEQRLKDLLSVIHNTN